MKAFFQVIRHTVFAFAILGAVACDVPTGPMAPDPKASITRDSLLEQLRLESTALISEAQFAAQDSNQLDATYAHFQSWNTLAVQFPELIGESVSIRTLIGQAYKFAVEQSGQACRFGDSSQIPILQGWVQWLSNKADLVSNGAAQPQVAMDQLQKCANFEIQFLSAIEMTTALGVARFVTQTQFDLTTLVEPSGELKLLATGPLPYTEVRWHAVPAPCVATATGIPGTLDISSIIISYSKPFLPGMAPPRGLKLTPTQLEAIMALGTLPTEQLVLRCEGASASQSILKLWATGLSLFYEPPPIRLIDWKFGTAGNPIFAEFKHEGSTGMWAESTLIKLLHMPR